MRFVVPALVFLAAAVAPPEPQRTLYPPNAWPIVSTFGSFDAVGGGRRPAPNPGVDIIALVRTPVFATSRRVGERWSNSAPRRQGEATR